MEWAKLNNIYRRWAWTVTNGIKARFQALCQEDVGLQRGWIVRSHIGREGNEVFFTEVWVDEF